MPDVVLQAHVAPNEGNKVVWIAEMDNADSAFCDHCGWGARLVPELPPTVAAPVEHSEQLRAWLVSELLKLDGKCLDEMADVQSVAEALARALEARAQKKET